jgi:hypothetical protein
LLRCLGSIREVDAVSAGPDEHSVLSHKVVAVSNPNVQVSILSVAKTRVKIAHDRKAGLSHYNAGRRKRGPDGNIFQEKLANWHTAGGGEQGPDAVTVPIGACPDEGDVRVLVEIAELKF